MSRFKNDFRYKTVRSPFWSEAVFAWKTLLKAILLATFVYALTLVVGYPLSRGLPMAIVGLLLMISTSFFQRQTLLPHRTLANKEADVEQFVRVFGKLSKEDQDEVLQSVLKVRPPGKLQSFSITTLMMSLFLLITGVSVVIVVILNSLGFGFSSLITIVGAVLVLTIVIVVYIEGLRALNIQVAKEALERILD